MFWELFRNVFYEFVCGYDLDEFGVFLCVLEVVIYFYFGISNFNFGFVNIVWVCVMV